MMRLSKFSSIFSNRQMLSMYLLGFASGLPLMLIMSNLSLWFSDNGLNLKSIGLAGIITIPYTLKFLWAPFLDRFSVKFLDKRRSWMFLSQIVILLSILSMVQFSPDDSYGTILIIGLIICFASATFDIAFNAYQVDTLAENDRGLGASISVFGFRTAMFVSGSLGLIFAQYYGWTISYIVMSSFTVIGFAGIIIAPKLTANIKPSSLKNAVILPFKEFFKRSSYKNAIIILFIIIIYKLGDQLAFALNSVFFKDGLGFNLVEIAFAFKTNALIFTIFGFFVAGIMIKKLGVYRSIIISSIAMALSNLFYMSLALVGKSYILMAISVAVEYFCGALGTIALVTLIMSLCNKKFSATQFAIFASLDSIGRVFISPVAGYIADEYSWALLFSFSSLIGFVITIILFKSKNIIVQFANLKSS